MAAFHTSFHMDVQTPRGAAGRTFMVKLLTTDEVATLTGLSPETLAQWRWLKKELPFVRLGKKCVRYRESDIDAWLAKRLVSVSSGQSPERR
jgi:excisionase family DNA binding protein